MSRRTKVLDYQHLIEPDSGGASSTSSPAPHQNAPPEGLPVVFFATPSATTGVGYRPTMTEPQDPRALAAERRSRGRTST